LLLLVFSCKSRSAKNQEMMQAEIDQLHAQISELEQSHEKIRMQMEQVARELEADRARIQLSKSSLELMGKTNQKQGHSWSDFWQNLGVIFELGLLGLILWTIYMMREQSRNQVSTRELETIIERLIAKSREEKEAPKA
jgi:hypothetical protein